MKGLASGTLPKEVVTMARAVVVRYETRPDAGDRNQHLIEQVFAELNAEDSEPPRAEYCDPAIRRARQATARAARASPRR
jgi:hypothetical protein